MFRCSRLGLVFLFILSWSCVLPAAADESIADPEPALVELYKNGKLFDKKEYKKVRAVFARQFESTHQKIIQQAFGSEHEELAAWLKERTDLREDFYTALNEKYDKLEAALQLFKEIWKSYPEQAEKYGELAIATAVTWDDHRAVYDYVHHQVRCQSQLASNMLQALENFKYYVDNEKVMQGRAQFLPWECLVLLVDHKTPADERKWAQDNYLSKRLLVGQCYKEVPYDHDLLAGKDPHLKGKSYTLENIRKHGGVCAMQADFASRVGKSIGVPAVYVTGQASSLGLHAWVMWVELKQVTKTQILFTLESHGRYFGDQYYTGNITDPQTGQKILDRDLERRLAVVCLDRPGKRQAELIMRAYPFLSEKQELDVKARVAYLDKCLKVSAYNEDAWLELARLAKQGELGPDQLPIVNSHLQTLFKTFQGYPDFTWKIWDDLLSLQPSVSERSKRYEKLVAFYEQKGRPDLSCDARLKLVEYQCRENQWKNAANGLAFTIRKFPEEGRYIPKMMEKLQEVCGNYKEGTELLSQFYLQFLPTIPRKRGTDPNKHCINMYEQAIAFFQKNKKDKVALSLEAELAAIRGGKGR